MFIVFAEVQEYWLKRALYFITCKGRMMYATKLEENYITRHLIYNEKPNQMLLSDGSVQTYEQMSLFDFMGVSLSLEPSLMEISI